MNRIANKTPVQSSPLGQELKVHGNLNYSQRYVVMDPVKRWNVLLRMAMTRVLVFRKFSMSIYWLYISILLKIMK